MEGAVLKGSHVFLWFCAFFGVIIIVNGIFIYTALNTHTGTVTEKPYEKGLAYNDILAQARSQPKLDSIVTFENGMLNWYLKNEQGMVLDGAQASAKIIRPSQKGMDFEIILMPQGNGRYETPLNLPLKGKWTAKLSAKWNNKNYQTTHRFITK